jgi:hypothetical protein
MAWCPPLNSKPVVVWLKEEGFHALEVWQVAQVMGIPAATWPGNWAAE